MRSVDLAIIGGGSAGLSAAISARNSGVEDILIIERSPYLGGILRQCIHNGFGVHKFKEDLTGVEYAARLVGMVESLKVPVMLNSFVVDLDDNKVLTIVNPEVGLIKLKARAVVLAMGCRERTRAALTIPGARCAGVLTAGTVQRYMNIEGYMPGKRFVILGSGDIGLIMARQLVIEGAEVSEVVEIMPFSSGLARNITQCLDDFQIPLTLSSTVTRIIGKNRVEKVVISQVDENRQPILGTEREVECDALMISAGLIPENDLLQNTSVALAMDTKGAIVNERLETTVPGIFSAGNVLHVHDLVDFVSEEGENAGRNAADYVLNKLPEKINEAISIEIVGPINQVVPQILMRNDVDRDVAIMFRARNVFRDAVIRVESDDKELKKKTFKVLAPGEMSQIILKPEDLKKIGSSLKITLEE